MKIAMIGFGTVGQGFVDLLVSKREQLQATYNFAPQVVAVATRSRGTLYQPDGLNLEALQAIGSGQLADYPDETNLSRDWDAMQIITQSNADVIVEVAHSNLETGQPATDYIKAAFAHSKHVVLANKGPVALAYDELASLAQQHGCHFRFEGTVMAGTPAIQLAMDALAGAEITAVKGILNGTTNYILSQMESGMSYTDALAEAQRLGYAEADPTADVDGWDAAGKVLILAASLFGKTLRFDDLQVQGIAHLTIDDIKSAKEAGERWKLIAQADAQGGSVSPMRLPLTDPLTGVGGATNAITLKTDVLGDVTLIGAGAGRTETGFAILGDLLAIHLRIKDK